MSEERETQEVNYREEVLRFVTEGKIKQTTKYVEKASDETLEKIYKKFLHVPFLMFTPKVFVVPVKACPISTVITPFVMFRRPLIFPGPRF